MAIISQQNTYSIKDKNPQYRYLLHPTHFFAKMQDFNCSDNRMIFFLKSLYANIYIFCINRVKKHKNC